VSHLLLQPSALFRILLSSPFLLFLPGYATTLALQTPPRPPRLSEGLFVSVLLSVLLVSPVGLLLAELGIFSLTAVCALTAGYSGVLLLVAWRRGQRLWPRWATPDRWDLILLVLVVIAIPLYARPHEYILGGADAGVYINIGANLAKTGRLTVEDPLVAEVPPAARSMFFRQHPESSAVTWSRFPAFFIDDPDRGLVIPQFFHLHPMWLGLAFSAGGIWGELLLTPLWAILGGVSLYFAAAAAFGRRVGTLALTLLTACALQVWFARYPTAEALTQFLLFGATYATILYVTQPEHPSVYGLAAGLGWGSVQLVRIDAFYAAAVPGGIVLLWLLSRRWQRRHWCFVLPWLLVTLQGILHAVLIAHDYSYDTFKGVSRIFALPPVLILTPLALGLLALGILLLKPTWWSRLAEWVSVRRRPWGGLLALFIITSAAYAYFLRPILEEASTFYYWYGGHAVQISNHENLVRLGWYLSPLGLALGTLGIAWAMWSKANRRTFLFFGLGVFSSYLYLYNILNNPHQVYAMRRYLPAVVPTFAAGAAISLDWLWTAARRQRLARALVGLVGLALLGQLLWVDRIFAPQVDNQGLVDQLDALAADLPADDLILFSDSTTVGWGDTLGTALTFLHGRQVMTLRQEQPDPAILSEQLAAWTASGRGVTVVPGHRPAFFNLDDWSLEPAGEHTIQYRALESSYTQMPRQITEYTIGIEFYRVLPASHAAAVTLPYLLDIGTGDFGALISGFYGREAIDGRTFRWAAPEASLSLPTSALLEADTLELSLAAPRPEGDVVVLHLALDGTAWTTLSVGQAFSTYVVSLPALAPTEDRVMLTLQTEGWNPEAAGVSQDNRDLGVMLDWAELD
jgi:hypothetical protein